MAGVQTLKYKNKNYPVKLGYYALKMLQVNHKKSMEDMAKDISIYEPLLFYSLEQGAKVKGTKLDLKLADMSDMLDDVYMDFVKMIPLFFPDESSK